MISRLKVIYKNNKGFGIMFRSRSQYDSLSRYAIWNWWTSSAGLKTFRIRLSQC